MYKKGTIVLVPFPFTDLSGQKVRPALIISEKNVGSDIAVLFITSKHKKKFVHTVSIPPSDASGIKVPSEVMCSKIATLDVKIILGELGYLGKAELKKVDTELKKVFGF